MPATRQIDAIDSNKGTLDIASNKAPKMRGRPFRRGHPGGPGRPEGSRNAATLVLDALADGEAADVLRTVVDAAKGGDLRAAEIVLARAWPVRKGRPVAFPLPALSCAADVGAAQNAVLCAVAEGVLSPDEGEAVATLIEVRRRSIELIDIETRLAALESRKNT